VVGTTLKEFGGDCFSSISSAFTLFVIGLFVLNAAQTFEVFLQIFNEI
jgi:hypothetical protein